MSFMCCIVSIPSELNYCNHEFNTPILSVFGKTVARALVEAADGHKPDFKGSH
jgi:hypothetical protein